MPSKHYLQDHVIRFSKTNVDSVVRCFFYSVLTLRLWKQVKIDQECVQGTDVWFPVPKGDPSATVHETRVREFVQNIMQGRLKIGESGTIVVTKFATYRYRIWNPREEFEKWYLNYKIDVVDSENLSTQLATMMQELTTAALFDGQHDAPEDTVEFDIQFVQ